jgi:hypothetical protein
MGSIHIQPAVEKFAVEQQLRATVRLVEQHGIVLGQQHSRLNIGDLLIQFRRRNRVYDRDPAGLRPARWKRTHPMKV